MREDGYLAAMAHVEVNGTRLWVEDTGPGPLGETIVMSHGLLWSSEMFRPQIDHLRSRYRVVAWDHRGQGRSDDDARRTIGMELVTDDARAVIAALGLGRVHFLGLSMGGFVGMRIAARWPDELRSLVLLNTSCEPEPRANVPKHVVLGTVAEKLGLGLVADRVMPIMFGRATLSSPDGEEVRRVWREKLIANRPSIVRAVRGVTWREGIEHLMPAIRVPTLVVIGDEDAATIPAKGERIHREIAGAKLATIPRAGHSSTIENPAAVNAALDAFYGALPG